MYRLQFTDNFSPISMKPSPSGVFIGILLGILIVAIAAGWKAVAAAPGGESSLAVRPTLWKRAVAIAGRNDRWVPRRITEDQRVYDSSGNLEEKSFSTFAVRGARRAALEVTVLASQKNGADNKVAKETELARERARKQRSHSGAERDEAENPFAPENQNRVSVRALGPEKNATIAGRPCRSFAYTQTTREGVWDGVAYLDAVTGIPVRAVSVARVGTLPPPEDKKFDLKSLRISVDFEAGDVDSWRARAVRLDMEIEYRIAPLLTFEGQVRNTYRFSRYEQLAAGW